MAQKAGAFRSDIDNDIKDRPPDTAHHLGLSRGRILEVHAAYGAFLAVESHVRLRDDRLQPVLAELSLA